ncbi:hypothetical protein [Anaerobacillus alkalidiazotrophicus]|nr:hypothetical protein [Anaerobacillus alkalidiazotrophicus]
MEIYSSPLLVLAVFFYFFKYESKIKKLEKRVKDLENRVHKE